MPQRNRTMVKAAPRPRPVEPAKSTELARLETQKAVSAAAAETAANWAKQLKELLPSSVEAPKGSATISGDQIFECHILGYRALDKAAAVIAGEIVEGLPSGLQTVAIHSEPEVKAQAELRAFELHLEQIAASLEKEIETARSILENLKKPQKRPAPEKDFVPAGAAVIAVGTALKAAADLISLFKVDVTLNHKTWSIGDSALVAKVAHHLQKNGVAVYHPSVCPPIGVGGKSGLMARFERLFEKRSEVESLLAELALHLKKPKAAEKALLQRTEKRLQLAATGFDDLHTILLKPDTTTGTTPLAGLLRAETIRGTGNAHWLVLKSVTAGGGSRTQSSLWQRTATVSYSGGCVAEFMLFDDLGKIVRANVISNYSGFTENIGP